MNQQKTFYSTSTDLKIQILDYTLAGPPNLTYLGYGDCVWELKNTISGNTIGTESDGHQIKLDYGIPHTNAKCAVNGTLLLKVTISAIGERELTT